jgi:hypothetical protein
MPKDLKVVSPEEDAVIARRLCKQRRRRNYDVKIKN